MHVTVVTIRQPDLGFIGSETDAMTGTAVTFDGALLKALHFDSVKHFSRRQVAYLESKQIVHVDEAECLRAIYRKRPNTIAERTDGAHDLVSARIDNG